MIKILFPEIELIDYNKKMISKLLIKTIRKGKVNLMNLLPYKLGGS